MKTRRNVLAGLSASILFPVSGILDGSKPMGHGKVDHYARLYGAHREMGTEAERIILATNKVKYVYVEQSLPAMRKLTDQEVKLILSNSNTKILVS